MFTGACPPVLHRSEGTRWGSTTRLQPKRENYYVFDACLFHRRTFRLTLSVNPSTRRHTLGWEREHVEEENCIFLRCRRRQLLLWPGEWSFFYAYTLWRCLVLDSFETAHFSTDLTFFVQGHPMKPHRMRMTHNLLLHYDLHSKMEVWLIGISYTVIWPIAHRFFSLL